jgi:hypothetical protein
MFTFVTFSSNFSGVVNCYTFLGHLLLINDYVKNMLFSFM